MCSDGAKLCDRLFSLTRVLAGLADGGSAIDCRRPRMLLTCIGEAERLVGEAERLVGLIALCRLDVEDSEHDTSPARHADRSRRHVTNVTCIGIRADYLRHLRPRSCFQSPSSSVYITPIRHGKVRGYSFETRIYSRREVVLISVPMM